MRRLIGLILALTIAVPTAAQRSDADADTPGQAPVEPSLIEALRRELLVRQRMTATGEAGGQNAAPAESTETAPETKETQRANGAPSEEGEDAPVGPVYAYVPEGTRKQQRARDPGDVAGLRATMALARGASAEAVQLAERGLAEHPGHTELRLVLTRALIATGQPVAASNTLTPLLSASQEDWRPWYWSGTAALLEGRHDDAAKALNRALERDRQQPSTWAHRALAELGLGRARVAVNMLTVARRLDPDDPEILFNLGLAAEAANDPKLAVRAYRTMLSGPHPISSARRENTLARINALR